MYSKTQNKNQQCTSHHVYLRRACKICARNFAVRCCVCVVCMCVCVRACSMVPFPERGILATLIANESHHTNKKSIEHPRKRGSPQKNKRYPKRNSAGQDETNQISSHIHSLPSFLLLFFKVVANQKCAQPNHIKEPSKMCAITFWVEDLLAGRLVLSYFARCRHGQAESLRGQCPRRNPVQGLRRLHRPE